MLRDPLRHLFANWWPEITAVILCPALLGPFHTPVLPGMGLAAVAYAVLRVIGSATQKREPQFEEPPLEKIVRTLQHIQTQPKLAIFRGDLTGFTDSIHGKLLILPPQNQDPSLRALARETAQQVLQFAQAIVARPVSISPSSQSAKQFRRLIQVSREELEKSFSAIGAQNDAVLAQQIEQSGAALETLHQQIRNQE